MAAVAIPVAAVVLPTAAPPAGPGGALAVGAAPAGGVAALPAGCAPCCAAAGGIWVLDEPAGDHNVGDEFILPGGALRLGEKALVTLAGDVVSLRFLSEGVSIDDHTRERHAFLAEDP